jgi:translation elongation factor EF-Ts
MLKSGRFFTTAIVKSLRDRTGAPIMKCREAFEIARSKCESDRETLEAAVEYLRNQGIERSQEFDSKIADQSVILVTTPERVDGNELVLLSTVTCETDFAARSEILLSAVSSMTHRLGHALRLDPDVDCLSFNLESAPHPRVTSTVVKEVVQELSGILGEKIVLNFQHMRSKFIGVYLHGQIDLPMDYSVRAGTNCALIGLDIHDYHRESNLQNDHLTIARRLARQAVAVNSRTCLVEGDQSENILENTELVDDSNNRKVNKLLEENNVVIKCIIRAP